MSNKHRKFAHRRAQPGSSLSVAENEKALPEHEMGCLNAGGRKP